MLETGIWRGLVDAPLSTGLWKGPPRLARMRRMRIMKAHVREGRVVLDEPMNLPEGAEVRVALLDEHLDKAQRERLDAALDEAEREFEAGQVVSEDELWARLRDLR